MNLHRITLALGLLIALGSTAHANSGKTRADVKAELEQAISRGDIMANGESGLKLNELYPQRYPQPEMAPMKSRADVRAELDAALRSGDILADGESGLKRNELAPQRYPARELPPGKPRAQVKAELAEAIRTGDMLATGESGLKLNELYPQHYANVKAGTSAPAIGWSAAPGKTVLQ